MLSIFVARFKRICHIHPNGRDYLKAVGGARKPQGREGVEGVEGLGERWILKRFFFQRP